MPGPQRDRGSTVELELLAAGYGLVEGPRTDADDNLYFTDIPGRRRLPPHARTATIDTLVTGRQMVGGLALHADGGFVMSGPTVAHWTRRRDPGRCSSVDGVNAFNDIQPDAEGRVYAGAIRSDLTDLKAEKVPAECYRIGLDGAVDELYGGIEVSNGIGLLARRRHPLPRRLDHEGHLGPRPGRRRCRVSNRRHIGRAAFERGIPDGMCVDADGNLWVAHVGGRRVVKLSPAGDQLDEIPVPAKAVTSVAFGGPRRAPTCTSSPPTTSTSPTGAAASSDADPA